MHDHQHTMNMARLFSIALFALALLSFALAGCSASPDYLGEAGQVATWRPTRVCDEIGVPHALSEALWDVEWTCEDPDATVVAVEGATKCSFWGVEGERWIGCSPELWHGDLADIILAHEIGHLEGYGHPCELDECEEELCDIMAPSNAFMDLACVRSML